ncbi:hypothetical protein [Mycolicibacterium sp. XJ1819]
MSVAKSRLDERLESLGAWSGVAWFIFAAGGFIGSRLVPAKSPATNSVELAAFISDHKIQILVGMTILLIGGFPFLITWSLTLAYQIKLYVNPSPLAFNFNVAVGGYGAIIGMLTGVIGCAMAFRVDTMSPDTTQLLYDLIFFLFLIPWPAFAMWLFVVGFAILSDCNSGIMFPRWVGYFSMWAGALEVLAFLPVFWYSGPWSYNGLVAFWVPGGSFFIWVVVLAVMQVSRIKLARANAVADWEYPELRSRADISDPSVVEPTKV